MPVDYIRPNLEMVMFSKVGGIFGLGGGLCITRIKFERNIYLPGELIAINVDCDNTKCSSAVRSIKLKLKRKLFLKYGDVIHGHETSASTFLVVDKTEGCAAKERVTRELAIEIPTDDVFGH